MPQMQGMLCNEQKIVAMSINSFSDEIKVDVEDAREQAMIIAFSAWGILRGLESFSQLIYTNVEYPGVVRSFCLMLPSIF